jgi:phenylacetate-CoA ligase
LYRRLAKLLLMVSDNFEGTCIERCRKHLERTQWMKRQDIQRLQFKRLKSLLAYAYEVVPHYRRSFRASNFHPNDLKSMEDLCKVPILKRQEIRDEQDELLANDTQKRNLVLFFTSGTTAAPLRFYRSKADLSWGSAAELRAYSWAGYEIGDKRGVIWGFEPKQTQSLGFRLKRVLRRDKILNVQSGLSEEAMMSFATRLHKFKPDFVRGYGASTNLFATFLLQKKQFKIRPQAVSTSATMLFPHYRRAIEKAFGSKIYDFYGSREISSIAAQCGQHEGLHISEENVIVEVVKDNEPASYGEEGRILLTNLHSYVMPFIRYDIGDFGKIFPDICSCGRQLSLMKPIGRTYEYFVNSDGFFTFLRDLQLVFEDLPIKEFQVVQESYDEIIVKIVPRDGYTSEHADFILKNIKLRGRAEVKIQIVNSLSIEKASKMRHVVSKLASKYT